MALFDRLRLSKDLAMEGLSELDHRASDATAIRGIVHVDLAFDVAARAALDHLQRTPLPENFPTLLTALPELGPHRSAMQTLHRFRNDAQHGGIAPPAAARQQLASDGTRGLEIVFGLAGSDFRRFSSIPQLISPHFREPLTEALALATTAPADAMALAMVAFERLKGWAEQLVGEAAIPNEMGLHQGQRWDDVFGMAACEDNRNELIDGVLRVSATAVLKMPVPAWIRINALGEGHRVRWNGDVRCFEHDGTAESLDEMQVTWVIETVARAALALEVDWPEFILVVSDGPEPELPPQLRYGPVRTIDRRNPRA